LCSVMSGLEQTSPEKDAGAAANHDPACGPCSNVSGGGPHLAAGEARQCSGEPTVVPDNASRNGGTFCQPVSPLKAKETSAAQMESKSSGEETNEILALSNLPSLGSSSTPMDVTVGQPAPMQRIQCGLAANLTNVSSSPLASVHDEFDNREGTEPLRTAGEGGWQELVSSLNESVQHLASRSGQTGADLKIPISTSVPPNQAESRDESPGVKAQELHQRDVVKTISGSDSSSAADSSSSSDSDSDSSSVSPRIHSRIRRALAAVEDGHADSDDEGKLGPIRTKNERDLDGVFITPIDVDITPQFSLVPVGFVKSLMEKAIVIESLPNALAPASAIPNPYASSHDMVSMARALDADTVLCLADSRRPLGRVFETFGPVTSPFYVVRFNSQKDIENFGDAVHVGAQVSYVAEMSSVVVAGDIRRKGYDASNIHDEELPTERLDYSDDEAEAVGKRVKKRSNSTAHSSVHQGPVGSCGTPVASGRPQKRIGQSAYRGGQAPPYGHGAVRRGVGSRNRDEASFVARGGQHHSRLYTARSPQSHLPNLAQRDGYPHTGSLTATVPETISTQSVQPPQTTGRQPLYHNGVQVPSIHPMMARQYMHHQQFAQQPIQGPMPGVFGDGSQPPTGQISSLVSIPGTSPVPYPAPQAPWRPQIHGPIPGYPIPGMSGPVHQFPPEWPPPYPQGLPFAPGNIMHQQSIHADQRQAHGPGLVYGASPYMSYTPSIGPLPGHNLIAPRIVGLQNQQGPNPHHMTGSAGPFQAKFPPESGQ
jgi:Gar1/Naf1 RNA binding region